MEYVGSGMDYDALPENGGVPNEARQITESNNGKVWTAIGGVPDETRQITESNNGKVWTAITDHNGKFKIGGNQTDDPIFEVDQQLGFVTIPEGSIAFNLLSDLTPQLGGNLDVNGNEITSASDGNVVINPNGTGVISLDADVGIGTTNPGSADLAIVHPRDATNFARVSIGQNVDGQGSTGGNHLGLWYGNANSDRADIFTSAGNMNFWVDGAADGTGQFTFGRTFNTEWMRIDDSGRLLVGTSTSRGLGGSSSQRIQVEGTDGPGSTISLINNQNSVGRASIRFGKSRGADVNTNTTVADDDFLGDIIWCGADNTDLENIGGRITCQVDGTPGNNVMPGSLVFYTNNGTASATPTERMRISANGNITVDTNTFFVDAVNDRVGVGTTSPGRTLDVSGVIRADGTSGALAFGGNSSTPAEGCAIHRPANDQMAFVTNNTEHLRIDSSGNVGIGTSSPDNLLEVDAGTGSDAGITIRMGTANSGANDSHISFQNSAGSQIFRAEFENDTPKFKIFSDQASDAFTILRGGNVGVGTASPDDVLDVRSGAAGFAQFVHASGQGGVRIAGTGAGSSANLVFSNNHNAGITDEFTIQMDGGTDDLRFIAGGTGGTEACRITEEGRLLIGTSSSRSVGGSIQSNLQIEGSGTGANTTSCSVTQNSNNATGPRFMLAKSRSGSDGGVTVVQSGDTLGIIDFAGADGTDASSSAVRITAQVDDTPGSNDMPGRLMFSTTPNGQSTPLERMRINDSGDVTFGNAHGSPGSFTPTGATIGVSGYILASRSGNTVLLLNRKDSDGRIVTIAQNNNTEGSIDVNGTTVSFNGGHLSRWSQLPGGAERTEILRGSVLSNIDEMCEWGEEENEQLNRMQLSDVEGDKNVSGVFQAWDDDDDTYTNDFYCAMTGDFVIRIAQGVTVERGDLLMSAGDGTAKPQDDDIIRSKTIAKVTSTNVSCTYEDGSYCVPCVLMAC
jgi:hypothetical protein